MPEFFIQAPGFGRLVLKRLQIHHPRQRSRPAAGLMPLVAMQRNGIRLQPAGKKIGRERHPARQISESLVWSFCSKRTDSSRFAAIGKRAASNSATNARCSASGGMGIRFNAKAQ
jgi:hypothetical protein